MNENKYNKSLNGTAARIFYVAGPGDVIETYRHWRAGSDDPNEVARTYSEQFFSVCHRHSLQAYVVTSYPRADVFNDGSCRIENLPDPSSGARGARYHLLAMWYSLRLILKAMYFRADVMVVSNTLHWFLFCIPALCGIKVIPTLHCVLWPKHHKPRGPKIIIHKLNKIFFDYFANSILSISEDVSRQVRSERVRRRNKLYPFTPSFIRDRFTTPPPPAAPPFRVCYAGRIERDKGVFMLLDICCQLRAAGRTDIQFTICGSGSALTELRDKVTGANIGDQFHTVGKLGSKDLLQVYNASHVIIVPTTSSFVEGFNKVVAEGILSARPVISSDVCPAVEYFPEAVVSVPVDDALAYREAIIKLCDDHHYYHDMCAACLNAREGLFDPSRGWGAALDRALSPLLSK